MGLSNLFSYEPHLHSIDVDLAACGGGNRSLPQQRLHQVVHCVLSHAALYLYRHCSDFLQVQCENHQLWISKKMGEYDWMKGKGDTYIYRLVKHIHLHT